MFEITSKAIRFFNRPEDVALTNEELRDMFHLGIDCLKDMIVDIGWSDRVLIIENEDIIEAVEILIENNITHFVVFDR